MRFKKITKKEYKRIIKMKIKILFLLIIIFIPTISIAQSEVLNKQEILQSQQSSLNISSFIQEAQEYSSNVYKDINFNELFSSSWEDR